MKITHSTHGSTATVLLRGRLDAEGAPALRRALLDLQAAGSRSLILDFEGVSFVDSSGLSVLVTALKNARAAGGDIAITRPGVQARMLLELTRLHLVFLVADDEDAARIAMAV